MGNIGLCSTHDAGYTQRSKDDGRESRVEASLLEPKLDFSIVWTRRGVLFWEDNRSHDTMVPSLRYPDLLPKVAMALTVARSAALDALPYQQTSIN